MLTERTIDAEVELVLVVGVVRGAGVVVGCLGIVGGQREAIEQSDRRGVALHLRAVDGVVGELGAQGFAAGNGGGVWVVDLRDAREVVLSGNCRAALGECGNGRGNRLADELLDALVIAKDEQAVMQDRATQRRSVEIAAILRLARNGGGGREVVAGVQGLIAEVFEEAAVDRVRAGAGSDIDDSAVEAAEFGGHVVGLHGELRDVVE